MMKRIVSIAKGGFVFLLLAAILNVAWPLASADGANLLFNPGFEIDGGTPTTADGWELFTFGGQFAERQTVMPHSGVAHVLLEGDPALGANFAVIVQRELPVVVGTDYAFSFFAKASAVDGPVGYRLEFYDAADSLIGGQFDLNVFIDSQLTSSYQQFSSIFTAPPNAVTGTVVTFWETLSGPTSVNWDDMFFGPVSADFDGDGDVDGDDFLAWQRGAGTTANATPADGDANIDGAVNDEDLAVWELQFGTVPPVITAAVASIPEPATLVLGCAAMIALLRRRPLRLV